MNLSSGGKQPRMRLGMFNGVSQAMVFPDDYPDEKLRGQPKGLRVVLQERRLWPEGGLKAKCKKGCKGDTTSCCAERVMSFQDDFRVQKSQIAEIIEASGHKRIFYPKFH